MAKYILLMLTHNRADAVADCIKSLQPTLDRADVLCVVLDNGSTDGTADDLRRVKNIHLLLSTVNWGVAGGRAKLLEVAQNSVAWDDCEYAVFLDSDTQIVENGWLDRLGGYLDQHDDIGIVGPGGSMVKADWSGFTAGTPDAECDCVAGFCQMVRRELIDYGVKIDAERYPNFWTEDSDLCLQVRALGWDVYCLPVGVAHRPSHSGYGQDMTLHDAHFALFRERWQGKRLIKIEGGY